MYFHATDPVFDFDEIDDNIHVVIRLHTSIQRDNYYRILVIFCFGCCRVLANHFQLNGPTVPKKKKIHQTKIKELWHVFHHVCHKVFVTHLNIQYSYPGYLSNHCCLSYKDSNVSAVRIINRTCCTSFVLATLSWLTGRLWHLYC